MIDQGYKRKNTSGYLGSLLVKGEGYPRRWDMCGNHSPQPEELLAY